MPLPSILLRRLLHLALFAALCVLGVLSPRSAEAQVPAQNDISSRMVPGQSYYAALTVLYDGDYRDAQRMFRNELQGAIKTAQSSWIDSICYHTMQGECLYQMGNHAQALQQYTAALKLYSAFSDWMLRAKFAGAISPDTSLGRKQIPWGRSTRAFKLGRFPDTTLLAQGAIDGNLNDIARRGGGVVQRPILYPVNIQEIVRCTCLAMSRRRELLGPLCKIDPLTADLLARLQRRPGPQNWSEAWIDLQLGLAHASAGETAQAEKLLNRAKVAGGEYDHPLTCVAMLELGRLALQAGDFRGAGANLEEAGYSAFYYEQYGVLEEAFKLGVKAHILANNNGIYPPLPLTTRWAKSQRLRNFLVWVNTLAADNYASQGNSQQAMASIAEARAQAGRRDCGNGAAGAQLNYLTALVNFQRGNAKAAADPLAAAMAFAKAGGSKWALQITLADSYYSGGSINERLAMDLYKELLRDPTAADWRGDPYEAISVLSIPHSTSYEFWFDAALKRKELDTALMITDMARRHRFFSTLPLGGRLLSLRHVVETPAADLPAAVALQRQDLLNRYPGYEKLSAQVKTLREKWLREPLVPTEDAKLREQKTDLEEIARLAQSQEAILAEMALRREPADMIFPPLRQTKDLQAKLPKGTAVLVFFSTNRSLHAFLLNNDRYGHWVIPSADLVQKGIAKLLREMGNYDANREVSPQDLAGNAWSTTAAQLMELLFKESNVNIRANIGELVIIPDGPLWYLPFEALPTGDANSPPLLTQMRIRYAPTLGLTVPLPGKPRQIGNLAVVVGKLFPRDSPTVADEAFVALHRSAPAAEAIRSLIVPTALYRTLVERLVVLDDVEVDPAAPYAWSPMTLDRGKSGGALAAWLPLPWGGPAQVILPGFHTAAETALKKKGTLPAGQEVFLSVTALMSQGARTVLISRWRMGGQTSFDLVREFVQELPFSPAADAWQRSVALAKERPLSVELEPRVSKQAADQALTPAHPLFWSGYLLVDTGSNPTAEEAPKADDPILPKLKLKQKPAVKAEAKAEAKE